MAAWPYNTARWQKLRRWQLQSYPLCRYCLEIGKTAAATIPDHIVPVAQAPERAFDPDNLQPLCESCHNRVKQSEERTGYRVGCDTSGRPVDPNHPWNRA